MPLIQASCQHKPLRATYFEGRNETKPWGNPKNPCVSFPPGKQKQSYCLPGPFHEKRNNYVVLFPRFLVHFGAPGKQFQKSPCFVSSYFPCFNFFPSTSTRTVSQYYIRVSTWFCLSVVDVVVCTHGWQESVVSRNFTIVGLEV